MGSLLNWFKSSIVSMCLSPTQNYQPRDINVSGIPSIRLPVRMGLFWFIAGSGMTIAEKYRQEKDGKFTIKTEIGSIIVSKILNLYPTQNIKSGTTQGLGV